MNAIRVAAKYEWVTAAAVGANVLFSSSLPILIPTLSVESGAITKLVVLYTLILLGTFFYHSAHVYGAFIQGLDTPRKIARVKRAELQRLRKHCNDNAVFRNALNLHEGLLDNILAPSIYIEMFISIAVDYTMAFILFLVPVYEDLLGGPGTTLAFTIFAFNAFTIYKFFAALRLARDLRTQVPNAILCASNTTEVLLSIEEALVNAERRETAGKESDADAPQSVEPDMLEEAEEERPFQDAHTPESPVTEE